MHEATLYERLHDGRVKCRLCSHRCAISPGKRGTCGVRENRDGTLETLVYGALVAQAVDPIEKKPLYHFLPGTTSYSIATVGCNLRCEFCQNWQISQTPPERSRARSLVDPVDVAAAARDAGCASIAYTYNEPTIFFEFARDTARAAHERGIANVFVTNGYQTPETIVEMTGLIDAANVDLKSFSDEFYRTHCGARLQPVLDSITAMVEAGIHVEITTLVIPGWNDGDDELRQIARFAAGLSPDIVWHVSRFHPDYQTTDRGCTPDATLERALAVGREEGLRHVFVGNASVGSSDTLCPKCGTAVVRRRGYRTSVDALIADEKRAGDGPASGTCGACGEPIAVVTRI